MRWFLFRVFGPRVCVIYGVVSMLLVAILASLYLTSGYALEGYVTDQLNRMPWDVAVTQQGEVHRFGEMRDSLAHLENIKRIEDIGFLRVRNAIPLRLEIDGAAFPLRWVTFVWASQLGLVLPELRRASADAPANAPLVPYQMALVATQGSGRGTEAVEASKRVRAGSLVRLALIGERPSDQEEDEAHQHDVPGNGSLPAGSGETVFQAIVPMPPVQFERQEFNRWMLRDVGSLSFLPDESMVIFVPRDVFASLADRLGAMFLTSEGVHGGEAPPPYAPEVTHLMALDRPQWVSPWALDESLAKIQPFVGRVRETAQGLTPFAYVNSDLQNMLARMSGVARLVQLVTVLVAVPLLWLGWVLARSLSGLLVLNERRLVGLALIRGVPLHTIANTLLLALLAGGLVGSLVGLVVGAGIPMIGYGLAGHSMPSATVFIRGLLLFTGFVVVGVSFALLSGSVILRHVRRMTPREAMARVLGTGNEEHATRKSAAYIGASFLALLLGGYKIVSWVAGYSLATRWIGPNHDALVPFLFISESVLSVVGLPLVLFGLTALLSWRVHWVQQAMSSLTKPFVGNVHWFVGQHMALRIGRIVTVLFVAALAMALTLLPQIAADTFNGRVGRGVRTSVGGDLQLEFNMTELSGGETKQQPLAQYARALEAPLAALQTALQHNPRIASLTTLQQFIVPDVFIPGQSGLMLNIVDAPHDYLSNVYYEQTLGLTRPFRQIIEGLPEPWVTASQGLLRLRAIPLDRDVTLGYGGDAALSVRFRDIVAFLPGQPYTGVADREGYVSAEVDYLNYMMRSDARMIVSGEFARQRLARLAVLPSRSVFVVRTRGGAVDDQLAKAIIGSLPIQPQGMRWEAAERQRVGKDMFVSLALENMKVFMLGGLILALASVGAVGFANFLADRRTLGLLWLRGVPVSTLVKITLSVFLVPVLAGVGLGILLGVIAGYGLSQAIWDLPRILGVAGFLSNRLVLTPVAAASILVFTLVLAATAVGLGSWPARKTAREAIIER